MERRVWNGKVVEYEQGGDISKVFAQLDNMEYEASLANWDLSRLLQSLKDYFYHTNPTSDRDFNVEVSMFACEYKEKMESAVTQVEWLLEDIENQREMIFDTFGKEV